MTYFHPSDTFVTTAVSSALDRTIRGCSLSTMKSPLSQPQSATNARAAILVKTEDDINEDTHENLEAIRASVRPSIV